MSWTFPTYEDAYDFAQAEGQKSGLAYGIEKPGTYEKSWRVIGLPDKRNRQGYELRCEAVEPGSPRIARVCEACGLNPCNCSCSNCGKDSCSGICMQERDE
jgi:hypothetical protein